jgi:3-oxoacyl-[acyl-carrier protein] reductase
MDLQLSGKSALVTGASRGIGLGIAASLASEGCRVAICARGKEALESAAEGLRERGADVAALVADVTDAAQAQAVVDHVAGAFGGLDILVGNVGGNRRGRFEEATDDDWEAVLDLNLRAHVRVARACIPVMKAGGGGAITFIASIFGREAGGPGLALYNSTKSALISLAKIMALELAGDGIRVNSVAPGSIRFPGGSWDRRCIEDPEGMARFIEANLPVGRFGRVDEVADVVTFLSSPRASWINGACLNVDGLQSRSLI